MPASSAASITARVPARSSRRPKLLQPRPTADTVSPERPSGFSCMARRMAGDPLSPRDAPRRRRRSPSPPQVRVARRARRSVRWLQPVQRRRRRRVPVAPILALARARRARRGRVRAGARPRRRRRPVARRRPALRRRVGARRPRGGLAADDGEDARGPAARPVPRQLPPGHARRDRHEGARRARGRAARREGRPCRSCSRPACSASCGGRWSCPSSARARPPPWPGRPTCGCRGSSRASASSGVTCGSRGRPRCWTPTGTG